MEDDFDIYAGVNAFCKTDKIDAMFEQSVIPELDNSESYEDSPDFLTEESIIAESKCGSSSKKSISKKQKRSSSKNNQEDILTKKVEKSDSSQKIATTVEPPHGNSPIRLRRSTRKSSPRVTTDSIATKTVPPKRGGRKTRSQVQNKECLPEIAPPVSNSTRSNRSQKGRARRDYMAELAARLDVVDTVDLISSPIIPISGLISLDSDDENVPLRDPKSALNLSLESGNPEISVKVKWMGKVETFQHRKYQKFSDLMKIFAQREDVDISQIIFNLGDSIIHPEDSPDSIGYRIFQFISGRVIKNATKSMKKKDANLLELKIQLESRKKPLIISIKKNDPLTILYIKCSEELNTLCENIKLSFDGELIKHNDTPEKLDFEGGEVIDCRLKK